jgi:ATP adenylyltransferase
LPFEHAGCRVGDLADPSLEAAATELHARYCALLASLALGGAQPKPYNLLLTRSWLALIPRRLPELSEIPVNALGYAGALLVRDPAAFDRLREMAALALLENVGFSTQISDRAIQR